MNPADPAPTYAVRVTPRASTAAITRDEDGRFHARVTCPPAEGLANHAVRALLARALDVPLTRLVLVRGARSRDKVFRLDQPPGGPSR